MNPGDGNVIAFNAAEGIRVDGSATTGNSIRANSIHSNAGAEIDNVAGGNTEPFAPALLATNGFGVNGVTCPNCVVDVFWIPPPMRVSTKGQSPPQPMARSRSSRPHPSWART